MFQITGSIGSSAFPSRVFKGMRMSGHMGNARVTVRNLRVLGVDKDDNLLVVEGAVPGPNGGYLIITKAQKPPRERRGFAGSATVDPLKAAKRAAKKGLVIVAAVWKRRTESRELESGPVPGFEFLVHEEIAMASIDIHDLSGGQVGTLELADEIFGAVNEDLLWEAVKHYRASQRAGTHATKNKKLVSGAGKKLWKQKGTGRARVGSIRSPLWRHGGTVHGPQPRSYDYAFPRKKLLGALRSALAAKFADGKLIVVKAFDLDEPKAKKFREALDALKVDRARCWSKFRSMETATWCSVRAIWTEWSW